MEKRIIPITPAGFFSHLGDRLMLPLMYLAAGTWKERPQQGHPWNKRILTKEERDTLDPALMVHCEGSQHAKKRFSFLLPMMHLPIFGGWRDYAVVAPVDEEGDIQWHIGWYTHDKFGPLNYVLCGVRRWVLQGPARLLIGPRDVSFFGIAASGPHKGQQIKVRLVARDQIGSSGPFSQTLLG